MLFLMLIIFFVFAFYLYMAYAKMFDPGECDGVISCFFFTVYRGGWWDTIAQSFYVSSAKTPSRLLKGSGGGGSGSGGAGGGSTALDTAAAASTTGTSTAHGTSNISVSRGMFDMFFFILITILMLSMVSGIIIDTFGSIR